MGSVRRKWVPVRLGPCLPTGLVLSAHAEQQREAVRTLMTERDGYHPGLRAGRDFAVAVPIRVRRTGDEQALMARMAVIAAQKRRSG